MFRAVFYFIASALMLASSRMAFSQEEPDRSPDGTPLKYHIGEASDPGKIGISISKLTRLEPKLAPPPGAKEGDRFADRPLPAREKAWLSTIDVIREHLIAGDSRAAVVISVKPLLVAAYSDDLDCVAMLKFPQQLVKEYGLKVGSRLLTVNTFETEAQRKVNAPDLHFGPKQLHPFTNVYPIIADFVTSDKQRVEQRKGTIGEDEWNRCEALGKKYHEKYPTLARNGSPLLSKVPAVGRGNR
jgi:hypothetical protein